MTETLKQIYERHNGGGVSADGDKGSTHSYIDEYEKLLAPYRKGCNFMEIGLGIGLSLAMWREYMPTSQIVGVDVSILFDPKPHTDSGTILITADATKPEFLSQLPAGMTWDVVVDDASHACADQVAAFQLLKPLMNPGGLYVIEDILDFDASVPILKGLHPDTSVLDLRAVKGRFDDVLVIYQF